MPWAFVPRKDVYGDDTRRGGAIIPRSDGFRMEQSSPQGLSYYKDDRKVMIVMRGAPPELKHLSRVRKRNTIEIPQVAASENGTA